MNNAIDKGTVLWYTNQFRMCRGIGAVVFEFGVKYTELIGKLMS